MLDFLRWLVISISSRGFSGLSSESDIDLSNNSSDGFSQELISENDFEVVEGVVGEDVIGVSEIEDGLVGLGVSVISGEDQSSCLRILGMDESNGGLGESGGLSGLEVDLEDDVDETVLVSLESLSEDLSLLDLVIVDTWGFFLLLDIELETSEGDLAGEGESVADGVVVGVVDSNTASEFVDSGLLDGVRGVKVDSEIVVSSIDVFVALNNVSVLVSNVASDLDLTLEILNNVSESVSQSQRDSKGSSILSGMDGSSGRDFNDGVSLETSGGSKEEVGLSRIELDSVSSGAQVGDEFS